MATPRVYDAPGGHEDEEHEGTDDNAAASELVADAEEGVPAAPTPVPGSPAAPGTPSTPGSSGSAKATDAMLVALRNTVATMPNSDVEGRYQEIERLKKMKADAIAARKRAQRLIRNEDRKKRRIIEKARSLSSEDMIHLIAHRAELATKRVNASGTSEEDSTTASSASTTSWRDLSR